MSNPDEPLILGNDTPLTLFLLRHRFQKSHAEFEAIYPQHRAFVMARIAEGIMLAGGPTAPWDGGAILLRAHDRAAVDGFIAADPLVTSGVTAYEVTEWRTTTRAVAFTAMVEQITAEGTQA